MVLWPDSNPDMGGTPQLVCQAKVRTNFYFIIRKNESGHDRPVFDLASKLDVRGPEVTC